MDGVKEGDIITIGKATFVAGVTMDKDGVSMVEILPRCPDCQQGRKKTRFPTADDLSFSVNIKCGCGVSAYREDCVIKVYA